MQQLAGSRLSLGSIRSHACDYLANLVYHLESTYIVSLAHVPSHIQRQEASHIN